MKNKRLDQKTVRKRLMLPKTITLHDDCLDVVFVRRQFKTVIDTQPHSSASYVLKRGRKTSPLYEIIVKKYFTNPLLYNDNIPWTRQGLLAMRSPRFTYHTTIMIKLLYLSPYHDFPNWSSSNHNQLMSDECLERVISKKFKVLVPKLKRRMKAYCDRVHKQRRKTEALINEVQTLLDALNV